jgi:hypothetical protein
MRKYPFVAAFAALAAACVPVENTSSAREPIIGGTRTPEGEYPGVGALYIATGFGFGQATCTGTLIAPDVVLTAAHCVDPSFIADYIPSFTLAHNTTSGIPPLTTGARTIAHPNFSLNAFPPPGVGRWYDIALLILAQPVTTVEPVRLPRASEITQLVEGKELHIVGYGKTTDSTLSTGGVMYHALTDLVDVGDYELQIASPGSPQNCQGDSGGPALADLGNGLRVVGVVSRSATNQPDCNDGGTDTRVDAYFDWIEENAPQVCIPGDPVCDPDPVEADAGVDGEPTDEGGGCSSTHPSSVAILLVALWLAVRRRHTQHV